MNNNLYYLNRCWDCEQCPTIKHCYGKLLSQKQKLELAEHNNHQTYNTNDKIYQLESTFKSLYIIKSGVIKLQTITENGDKLIKGFYFPGDLIGIESIGSQYLYLGIRAESLSRVLEKLKKKGAIDCNKSEICIHKTLSNDNESKYQ